MTLRSWIFLVTFSMLISASTYRLSAVHICQFRANVKTNLTRPWVWPGEPPHRTLRWSYSCSPQEQWRTAEGTEALSPPPSLSQCSSPSLCHPPSPCSASGSEPGCSCTCGPPPSPGPKTDDPQIHCGPPWEGELSSLLNLNSYSAESETFVKVPCCFLWIKTQRDTAVSMKEESEEKRLVLSELKQGIIWLEIELQTKKERRTLFFLLKQTKPKWKHRNH